MRKIISSIDLGSDSIKIVVAEVYRGRYHVLSAVSVKSKGIKRGLIINANDVIDALKEALKNIEDRMGLKIKKTIVNIPSNYAHFEVSRGSTTINNDNGVINGNDIVRCVQGSVYNQIPLNMELVTVIPIEFIIDDKEKIKEPLHQPAKKLDVKSVLITTPKKNIYTVLNVMEKVELEVSDIILGSVGDYYTFSDTNTDKVSGVIINIGHETTTVSIFNKGIITNTEILDIGNVNVDNDISFIYKINKQDAMYLKENLSLAHVQTANANEYEELSDKTGEKIKINQYEISEIVSSRVKEILELAKKQINLLTKKEISYIIITGGITEIKNFNIIVEEIFGKSATIGQIDTIGVRSGIYSCSLGMIKYFSSKLTLRGKNYSIFDDDAVDELSNNKISITNDSILGKIFGYFFDN